MARTRHEPDDEDDEPDDWSDDSYDPDDPETYPSGMYEEDELPTVPCPYCRAEVVEDAEQCPRCGRYLSREDAPAERKSGAWWVLILLALLAALIMTVG